MRNGKFILLLIALSIGLLLSSCKLPKPEQKKKKLPVKNNYIILLDLSDRLSFRITSLSETSKS